MPRKRRTKLTQRTKPKLPEEDSAHTMSEEEEKAILESFLKDFDIEVEKRVKAMRSQMKTMCSTIHQAFNLEILRLPSHVRDMKRSQFFGEKEADQIKEEFNNSVDQLLVSSMSSFQTAPLEKDGNGETLQDGTSTQNRRGTRTRKKTTTAKKRTAKATATRKKRTARQDENDPPTTAAKPTRQSTRATRASARKQQFETPANSASLSQLGYDTPFMTPKFDPRLPITPAMARLPRRGEQLMSKTGSPVINECTGALGNQTVQTIFKESSIRDTLQRMDEEEMEKVIAEELEEASLDANSRKLLCSKLHVLMDRILKNTADT